MQINKVSINFEGKEYTLETGRFAKFANGAIMVSYGDNMVLVTATASQKELENVDFLPLQVEYREKLSAAGKFPGGFLKRETRPSDKEILSARLIDRPIRPMITKAWHYETQIIATVYSVESGFDPDTLACVGASAALMISDIPFNGPISEVRVGRIDGVYIANPTMEQLEQSDVDITVAGSDNALLMVEGESKEISEQEFVQALAFAHEKVRELNGLQHELAKLVSNEKRPITEEVIPDEVLATIKEAIHEDLHAYVHSVTTKNERGENRHNIADKALNSLTEKFSENEEYAPNIEKWADKIVSKMEKEYMRLMILDDSVRLDGRSTTQIRPISCEVGLLPRTHGSSLFTRGETQSLSSVTLGTDRDEQMIDGLLPVHNQRFMLHYNFPPFSTGETGRMGLSRREVGHGNLAWRALKPMLPQQGEFPYAIRVLSDILESNGSSSMATVCAGSLALFDAGVPMVKPVAGIAMGLIKEDEKVAILSDILGDEDFLGDMDFKVAGTVDGITACQMDIKIEGLSVEILTKALAQAREGRLHILGIMNQTLDTPREDISQYAPRFSTIKIPTDTIGAVIGTGGETIRSICKEHNVEINIEDDGTVQIASTSKDNADAAIKVIRQLTSKPEEGQIYMGTVKEIREGLGAFVEILPKTQGLLHISQITHERLENVADAIQVGDKFEVKLLEITKDGKYRLSRKALLPVPEGFTPREERPRRDDRKGGGHGHHQERKEN